MTHFTPTSSKCYFKDIYIKCICGRDLCLKVKLLPTENGIFQFSSNSQVVPQHQLSSWILGYNIQDWDWESGTRMREKTLTINGFINMVLCKRIRQVLFFLNKSIFISSYYQTISVILITNIQSRSLRAECNEERSGLDITESVWGYGKRRATRLQKN